MISSPSGSNNISTFGGAQTPPPATQAFIPAGGTQAFNATQSSQAVLRNPVQPPSFTPTQTTSPAQQGANLEGLKSQLDTASDALKKFAEALNEALKEVSGDAGGVAKPPTPPQEQFKKGTADEKQPAPVVAPENQFKPAPSPESASTPMSPTKEPTGDAPMQPEGRKQDTRGRWRDERGKYVPSDKLKEQGMPVPNMPDTTGGGGGGAGAMLAKRHPLIAGAMAVGGFALSQAGSTSMNQALQGIPIIGGMLAGSFSKLEEMGMKGASFELPALQAGMTRGQGQGTGYATNNASYASIKSLSSLLGISPSASASMLRDVGVGTQGELSITDIAGLTVRGFDASSVSALGGQLRSAGVGGAGTVLQTMGIARAQGLSNAGVMSFAQATAGFATGRRMAGLDITDASMTARRARSMILPSEDRPSLEANLATLGRFQSVGVSASKGLSGFMAGMSEQMLQAYAFERAGGDIFKATAMLEDMSADPVAMREAMKAQGASDEQIDTALLATGQLTTTDIRRGRKAIRGEEVGRMRTGIASTTASLASSRAVAEKGQRDLEQLYGTEGGQGESVVSRFNTLLKAQTRYQSEVLKKMPTSAQINKIADKLIGILDATDFIKELATLTLGGSKSGITPDTQPIIHKGRKLSGTSAGHVGGKF